MKSETSTRLLRSGLGAGAFTRTELLVTIAIIAVLGSLLLVFPRDVKGRAQQAVCRANLKTLGAAFVLYCGDNQGAFPARGSASDYGPQPEDWIYWQAAGDRSGARDLSQSPIAKYASHGTNNVFRCPGDDTWMLRRYRYSYSFNASSEATDSSYTGMATFVSKDRSTIFIIRAASVRNPGQKIMVAEERGGPNDDRSAGEAFINDGAWCPGPRSESPNYLTSRHHGKADAAFADSHVEVVSRAFSMDPRHFLPER
jgi:type II secretory pathway pseudopilin PulG